MRTRITTLQDARTFLTQRIRLGGQRRLARKAGLVASRLQRFLKPETHADTETLQKVAEALGYRFALLPAGVAKEERHRAKLNEPAASPASRPSSRPTPDPRKSTAAARRSQPGQTTRREKGRKQSKIEPSSSKHAIRP